MKKRTLGAGVLTAMMMFSPIAVGSADASTQTTQQATQEVMWGKNELTQTQIGRIVFLKDVKIYKRGTDGVVSFHLNAKKGSMWRVHEITKEGNDYVYDLGGGVRVKQSNLSTFESPPTDLVEKQVEQYGAKISWDFYPQVSRLASKDIENKINESIEEDNKWIYGSSDIVDMDYSITQNNDNVLKLLVLVKETDSEIGNSSIVEYNMTYNLATGEVTKQIHRLID